MLNLLINTLDGRTVTVLTPFGFESKEAKKDAAALLPSMKLLTAYGMWGTKWNIGK